MHPIHDVQSESVRAQPLEPLNRRLAPAIDLRGQLRSVRLGVNHQVWLVESHVAPK